MKSVLNYKFIFVLYTKRGCLCEISNDLLPVIVILLTRNRSITIQFSYFVELYTFLESNVIDSYKYLKWIFVRIMWHIVFGGLVVTNPCTSFPTMSCALHERSHSTAIQ